MTIKIGYARCSTHAQDVETQRKALLELGVPEDDTLVVSKLDRLARSVPDARDIAQELERKGVTLALGLTIHDPSDPMGRMFFNIVATFAEFEADLIQIRTREDMAIAKSWGKAPKLSKKTKEGTLAHA